MSEGVSQPGVVSGVVHGALDLAKEIGVADEGLRETEDAEAGVGVGGGVVVDSGDPVRRVWVGKCKPGVPLLAELRGVIKKCGGTTFQLIQEGACFTVNVDDDRFDWCRHGLSAAGAGEAVNAGGAR